MTSAPTALLALALLPALATAADAPPLLPATASFENLPVPANSLREFDVELARTEKYLAFDLKSAEADSLLSGSLLITDAGDGRPLYDRSLERLPLLGGLIPLAPSTTKRRLRISLRGGPAGMRANMTLLPKQAQLKTGQVVPVFARRSGSDAFNERFELRLTKASDVEVITWGGDATATLRVTAPLANGGFPVARCESAGDAWRRCTLPALEAGSYQVVVTVKGNPLNLLATWSPVAGPTQPSAE